VIKRSLLGIMRLPLIRLLRPNEYLGICVFCTAIGIVLSVDSTSFDIGLILVSNISGMMFAFAFNDIEDAEDDKNSERAKLRNPISSGEFSARLAILLTVGLAILSVGSAFLIGLQNGAIALMIVLIGFLYSSRLCRFKSIPFVDLISHALFLGTLQFLGGALIGHSFPDTLSVIWLGALIFALSLLSDLNNEFRDYIADERAGLRNTVQLLGMRHDGSYVQYLSALLALILLMSAEPHVSTSVKFGCLGIIAVFVLCFFSSSQPERRASAYEVWSQVAALVMGMFVLAGHVVGSR
jgi:4-hydroxybenzoate polyprenyltransferase